MRELPAASYAHTSMVARLPLNVTGQVNGGAVFWQNTWLLTAVLTIVTPTLSDALAVTVCVPGASVAPLVGAVIVTLGGVVSGAPGLGLLGLEVEPPGATLTLTSARRELPAASYAHTSMVAKDPLNVTGQEYGGAVCWQNT